MADNASQEGELRCLGCNGGLLSRTTVADTWRPHSVGMQGDLDYISCWVV